MIWIHYLYWFLGFYTFATVLGFFTISDSRLRKIYLKQIFISLLWWFPILIIWDLLKLNEIIFRWFL